MVSDDTKVEVFRFGIEPMPDWFMDLVSCNRVTLHRMGGSNPISEGFAVIDGGRLVKYGQFVLPEVPRGGDTDK